MPKPKKNQGSRGSNLDAVFQQYPILQSDNVLLKGIDASHIEDLCGVYYQERKCNKDRITSMIGHFERDYHKKKCITWGIFNSKQSDRLIGVMQVQFRVKEKQVWFEYSMNRSMNLTEINKEAIKVMVEFMVDTVNMSRVVTEIPPCNEAAMEELLRIGFIHEGSFRQAAIQTSSGREIVDLQLYSIQRKSLA